MFLTIEEMYALKAEYLEEIAELQAKVAVVEDFIELTKAKAVQQPNTEEEEVVAEGYEEVSTETGY